MKFVYDLRKEEVVKSLFGLFKRTTYRGLFLYGLLCAYLGIVVLVIGIAFGGGLFVFLFIVFAILLVFAVFTMTSPPLMFKKILRRLSMQAKSRIVEFGEEEVKFIDEESEQILFVIPYNLILDVKANKDWIILILKPDFKNLQELQEKYFLPVLDLYRIPVTTDKLMIQDIEEITRLIKERVV